MATLSTARCAPTSAAPACAAKTPTVSTLPSASDVLFTRLAGLDRGMEREQLRAELVRIWLPMAYRIAGRFRGRGEDIEDLHQVGALGLVKAIDRFDPTQGAFESYAIPTITGEVKRHFRDRTWAVHVPRRVQEFRNKIRTARQDLTDRPGNAEPTHADIAARTGLTLQDVAEGVAALDSYAAMSLDMERTHDGPGYTLGDTLGSDEPAFDIAVDREAVKRGLRRLPERERAILYLRFFEDMTQSRIAERFGISQMQVCRLIKRSCAQVRDDALA
ncbi:SigB/SigF/SigG family RNA polymerase sigma factor [Streptomyces sp. NPDC055056]